MVANNLSGGGDGLEAAGREMESTCEELPECEDGGIEMAASFSDDISPPVDAPEDAKEARTRKLSVIFLCFYGFMTSLKPGEPFITPYLLSPEKNFTSKQVTNEITPVLAYSYMAVLVPAFLLTDFLRYKPVLVVQGLSQVAIWLIMLLGTTLLEMQFMEFFYGMYMACRVAYSSYIFSLVSPGLYQRVAGYSRSSVLMGVFTSSVLGQLCMSLGNVSYFTLNAVSLGFVSFSLLLSLCLPWPKRSLYFNRTWHPKQKELPVCSTTHAELAKMTQSDGDPSSPPPCGSWKDSIFVQMLLEVRNVLKRPNLRLWSSWWVFNSTGYYLVLFYVHILWNTVYAPTESNRVYNGGVEAASTLLSAITSFAAGYAKIQWDVWSELVIGVVTAVQAGLLLLMGTTNNIWVCYIAYVVFRGSYQFLVPIATFQIASSLTRELCGLVFGINTFLGTILKTIISLIVSDKRGFGWNVKTQFLVYFVYFAVLTSVYLVCAGVVIMRHFRSQACREGEASDQATPTKLEPVATDTEVEPLSNGQSTKA